MIITESQMGFGASNGIRLLDNMYYLSESESQYAPAMVPIVENTNVGKYMIALEDLQEFADSNGISDMGYALTCVCEADNLDPSYVGFTIQEENVIAYPDMANMVSNLLNEGVTVLAKPINPYDPVCIVGEACLDYSINSGNFGPFAMFIMEAVNAQQNKVLIQLFKNAINGRDAAIGQSNVTPFDPKTRMKILRNARDTLKDKSPDQISQTDLQRAADKAMMDFLGSSKMPNNNDSDLKYDDDGNAARIISTSDTNDENGKDVTNAVKELEYKGMFWPRKKLAQMLAWLHKKARAYNEKLSKDPKNNKWYQKILGYITRAIEKVTKWLHNKVSNDENQITTKNYENPANQSS